MWNARLDESHGEIKISRRNTNNLRYEEDMTLLTETKEKLKSLLMKVKEESDNAGLKLNIQKMQIMASSPITSRQIDGGKVEVVTDFFFLGSKITADDDCSHEIKKHLLLGRKAMANLESILKSRDISLLKKVHLVKAMVFPAVNYRCELDHKEGGALKNCCFHTLVLEKTLESPLDCKEIKPVNPKESQPWLFIGRTDAAAEAPILRPPDTKSSLIRKGPNTGKAWRQQEKRMTEEKMVRWHHWLNGHEFEQTPGDSEGQGSLVCCSPWGRKDSDTTEQQ